ncbi:hypothetical protein C1645_819606 [Glomus cerebriforme]|uniref:Uncharacterized protein n=1 Tax=Glomus cerebriforme TaxID=658196 RepID=A0A397TA61_9GLOM|nr:hypothetical protein C1645_819606 [Glomus cerebriforme]
MLPDTILNIRTLQVEHQILTAGNSETQNIDNRQKKYHREEMTDDEELKEVDDDESSSKIDSLNVVKKSLELPKDKSKRIKKSNIGYESSTSSRQNNIEVNEIDMTLSEAEKKMLPSSSGMNENVKTLLKKYNNGINDAMFRYDVNLMKLPVLFDETSIVNCDTYCFTREWPTQRIKSVFNVFLLCFQLPINPLYDCDLSEYSYRDKIVNRIIEDIFLNTYNFVHVRTDKVENTDRKDQKNSERPQGKQGVDENGICKAETFGILIYRKTFCFYSMHYVDDFYLVDQFEGFTIPDNSGQLAELLNIIEIIFTFKQRVMDFHHFVQSLYKQKNKFQQKSLINESAVKASPTRRKTKG